MPAKPEPLRRSKVVPFPDRPVDNPLPDPGVADDAGGDGNEGACLAPRQSASSQALRDDLWRELGDLGVSNKPAIFRVYDLETIAVCLEDLKDQLRYARQGSVRNPAGLLVRLLEWSTGRKLY